MDWNIELIGVPVADIDVAKDFYFGDPDGNRWALQELPDYSKADHSSVNG